MKRADALHDPSKLPHVGDRVLAITMSDSGWVKILFEHGEAVNLATTVDFEPQDSDTRDWQEQTLVDLWDTTEDPEALTKSVAARWLQASRS